MGEEKEVRIMWKTLPFDIFKRGVLLFVGPADELVKTCQEKLSMDISSLVEILLERREASGYTIKGGSDAIIWLPEPVETGTLVHEFVHAALWTMELVNLKLSEETEEILAYLIEYMYDNLVPWYENNINKEKCE